VPRLLQTEVGHSCIGERGQESTAEERERTGGKFELRERSVCG